MFENEIGLVNITGLVIIFKLDIVKNHETR